MKRVDKYLIVAWDGGTRVMSRKPPRRSHESVFLLQLQLPDRPAIDGVIALAIPQMPQPGVDVELIQGDDEVEEDVEE